MASFSPLDIIIVAGFFLLILVTGYIQGFFLKDTNEDFLLSGRNVGLVLFIFTNVSTWYGGILGVGEFTYSYGILSWVTQGFPYYLFALLFAIFFAKKIRGSSLFTIPEKIRASYGNKAALTASVIVFMLVSPAPYLLMLASLLSYILGWNILISLVVATIFALIFLIRGGYRSDLYTDAVQFFFMFAGFIILLIFSYNSFGGYSFLEANLPATHLSPTGGASPLYIIVWFLIALWTFADPGFHQRCYAAKTPQIASKGIIISILFWMFFDFLTTSTGLYARAVIKDAANPVFAFPALAERVLGNGFKGLFYAALFASILSTFNSFMFLSGVTIGKDFLGNIFKNEQHVKRYTIYGLLITSVVSITMAYLVPSVIGLWFIIGSICIPGILPVIIGSYFPKFTLNRKIIVWQMLIPVAASIIWYLLKSNNIITGILYDVEPMIIGLLTAVVIYLAGKIWFLE